MQDTGCEHVFGKMLRQLGLDTGRYVYIHDANATSNDQMMVGIVRFPTKSWFLWCLALLEISHFVWIKDNVKHIVYVGPRTGFDVLLELANTTKNRSLTSEEIEHANLALKGDSTILDACIYFERRFMPAVVAIATACWAHSKSCPSIRLGFSLHDVGIKVRDSTIDSQPVVARHTPR